MEKTLKIKGMVQILDALTGEVLHERENLIVNTGLQVILARLAGDGDPVIPWGTGTTYADVSPLAPASIVLIYVKEGKPISPALSPPIPTPAPGDTAISLLGTTFSVDPPVTRNKTFFSQTLGAAPTYSRDESNTPPQWFKVTFEGELGNDDLFGWTLLEEGFFTADGTLIAHCLLDYMKDNHVIKVRHSITVST